MPQPTPIVLKLYDEKDEVIKTCTCVFIPWKMLKKGIRLHKQFGSKTPDQYEEEDIDALAEYVMSVFKGQELTIEMLDEHAELNEMVTVIKSVVNRAKGIMDPTLPPTS